MKKLSAAIALRWLKSKKGNGASNAIAIVAVAGVAVATAAIVCVLSVFNGFRDVLSSRLDVLMPDITIFPSKGKTIQDTDSLLTIIKKIPEVSVASPVVKDQALAIFSGREMPVTLRGVEPAAHTLVTEIDSIIIAGRPMVADGELSPDPEYADNIPPQGIASIGVAARLGNVMPGSRLLIFAPRRVGRIDIANPLTSFVTDSLDVSAVFEARQSDFDEDMLIVPIETARALFMYDNESTSIDIKPAPGFSVRQTAERLQSTLGSNYVVKDRQQQQETNFKMVAIEKWITFLLLFFILTIANFNIISTMTMFVLDKRKSMHTLSAVGFSNRDISNVFRIESVVVTLTGAIIGIIAGLTICLLQQHYGFLHLNADESSLVLSSYPVKVEITDILLIFIPTAVIATLTAFISGRFANRKLIQASGAGMRL